MLNTIKNILVASTVLVVSTVSAASSIPVTPSDADMMVTSVRTKPYTVKVDQCKTDRVLQRAIAKDYYNSVMGTVESWKSNIEKTRALSAEEKKDYDYVKSAFTVEKNTPKYRTWYVCDEAMTTLKTNIEEQNTQFINVKNTVSNEYKTANMTTVNATVKTFVSSSLNKSVAVVNTRDFVKNRTLLTKYDVIVKLTTNVSGSVTKVTVMMPNDVVNSKKANFYGFPITSVSTLSLQKVYSAYVGAINTKLINRGKATTHAKSTRLGKIYYIEM